MKKFLKLFILLLVGVGLGWVIYFLFPGKEYADF